MDGDYPITRREEDRLGFSPIAEHLARAIVDQMAPQGFVLGIEGKWGSGKTTLINLTIDALKAYGARTPEIVSFSPWLVGDRDELLQTLFDELAIAAAKIDPIIDDNADTQNNAYRNLQEREKLKKALGPKLRAFGAVAGTLGKIARTADALGVPVAGAAGSFLERSGEAAQSLLAQESASRRKAELVDALKLLTRRIVVFIDDLDRLEPREASEVLRLIRAVADFPNIIYVLSYDPNVVAQILSNAIQVDDGAAFLEKIVQVSFRVPRPEAFDLRRWLYAEVRKLFSFQFDTSSDQAVSPEGRLWHVIDIQGGRYLETGRDVIRVLNALRLHAIPVQEQIDIVDMVWLQLLKIGNPDFYSWVEEYLTDIAAVATGRTVSVPEIERSVFADRLEKIFTKEKWDFTFAFYNLGEFLPGIEYDDKEPHNRVFANLDGRTLAPFVIGKRLGSPQHYRYYFAFSRPAGALPDEQVEAFVSSAEKSADEASTILKKLSRETRPQGGNLAEVLIDRLNAQADRIAVDAIPNIVSVLGETMDAEELSFPGEFEERFAWRAATRLLEALLGRLPANVREASIDSLFNGGQALGWLTAVIREEIFSHGLYGESRRPESDWILNEEEFSRILNIMLNRYRDTPAENLMRVPNLLSLLYAWRQGGRPDEVRRWVEKQVAPDAGLLTFLSRVRTWMNVNGIQYYPLKRRDLENFLDFDRAIQRLQAIAADGDAPSTQRVLAEELLTAVTQGERTGS
jgi:predicted KAP-like P-loop ATPase